MFALITNPSFVLRLCMSSFLFLVCPLTCTVARQEPQPSEESTVAKLLDDEEFFLAVSMKPEALGNQSLFQVLPLEAMIREAIPIGQLSSKPFDRLTILAGIKTNGKATDKDHKWDDMELCDFSSRLNIAAVATLKRPLSVEHLIKEWRSTTAPNVTINQNGTAVPLEKAGYFQVPSGTFLTPRRIYPSKLEFVNRRGEPSEGYNVGNSSSNGYIRGGASSLSRAILTFDHVDKKLLRQGRLVLDMRLHFVPTYFIEEPPGIARIVLESGPISSTPIHFEFESFKNKRVSVPEKIKGYKTVEKDGQIEDLTQEIIVANDLMNDGALRVRLAGAYHDTFIGLTRFSVNFPSTEFEYVYLDEKKLLVAQSLDSLNRLLDRANKDKSVVNQESSQPGDFSLAIKPRTRLDNAFLKSLIDYARNHFDDHFWLYKPTVQMAKGSELFAKQVDSVAKNLKSFEANFNFSNGQASLMNLAFQNDINVAELEAQVKTLLQTMAGSITDQCLGTLTKDEVGQILGMTMLMGMTLPEPPMKGPQLKSLVKRRIQDFFGPLKTEYGKRNVAFRFEFPAINQDRLSKVIMARVQADRATLFNSKLRPILAAEALEFATDCLAKEPKVWARRSHFATYNQSREFTSYENKYAWIRHGIEILLEGAETSDSPELIWIAGYFLAHKTGNSDERKFFFELFANDHELHKKMRPYVDLKACTVKTQNAKTGEVNAWLVAGGLTEYANRKIRVGETYVLSKLFIAAPKFLALPALCQARYAQWLDSHGELDLAGAAWKNAEEKYQPLVTRYRAKDDAQDPEKMKTCELFYLDYWLARSHQEQSENIRMARKLSAQGDLLYKKQKYDQAKMAYEKSLLRLLAQHEKNPKKVSVFLHDFVQVTYAYLVCCKRTVVEANPKLQDFLRLIENSEADHEFDAITGFLGPGDSR